jgi:two-component system, NarL family, invasion response regulator UvrY
LNTLLAGKKYLSGELKEDVLQNRLNSRNGSHPNPIAHLTNRELEVCQLLLNGMGVNEIAKSLAIHTSTASTIKHRIFEKLNAKSLKEIMDIFNVQGIRQSKRDDGTLSGCALENNVQLND